MQFLQIFDYTIFFNLSLAVVLGMIIGAERLYAHKTASMRTYAMVAMGASLFVTIAVLGGQMLSSSYANINPLYVVAQIISGIGFLGAGLIIFKDDHLTGVTGNKEHKPSNLQETSRIYLPVVAQAHKLPRRKGGRVRVNMFT
jgi:putative Mg2+ transporter-C (MgtC) family protein